MPNVPEESDYKAKVRTTAYPCQERNGVIWTYMGVSPEPPPFPDMEWAHLPDDCKFIEKQYLECNYAQGMEGDLDPSHISFLHAPLDPQLSAEDANVDPDMLTIERERVFQHADKDPLIMVLENEYGLLLGARRDADSDHYYWRMTHLRMPFYAFVPGVVGSPMHCNIWQPIDDENTMIWRVYYWSDRRPWTAEEVAAKRQRGAQYLPATTEPGSQWMPTLNRSNDYGIDYDVQRTSMFSGIPGIWLQDRASTEGMGPLMDRAKEHLGPSDVAVIQMRRMLIRAAKALQKNGSVPPGAESGDTPVAVPPAISLNPRWQTWEDLAEQHVPRRVAVLVGD
jgi:hypothetical protein